MGIHSIEAMLEPLGVSERAERVYLALLDHPGATATDLARLGGLTSERGIPALLHSLEALGLVSREPTDPPAYRAAPPSIAVEVLVLRRQDELVRTQEALQLTRLAAAELDARHRRAQAQTELPQLGELVEVLIGADAIGARYLQMQASAHREFAAFDKPPYTLPHYETAVEAPLVAALARGVAVRAVYDPEGVIPERFAHIQHFAGLGEEARVASVPIKLAIVDGQLAILAYRHGEAGIDIAMLIHPSPILDGLLDLFERVWADATPFVGGSAASAKQLTADASQMMMLMAAGYTDQAIGQQLGLHLTTVQRRVATLMKRAGCRSRFQLGLVARERGWVGAEAADHL